MNQTRVFLSVLAAVLAVLAVVSAVAGATNPKRPAVPRKPKREKVALLRQVNPTVTRRVRDTTWRWQALMGMPRTRPVGPLGSRRTLIYWRRHAHYVQHVAARPPHRRGWLCIHRFEGSWNDGGDPYWGGLQMDRGFMRSYAPRALLRRGWADHWTALEQMWVAERAHRSGRGFWPWPSTARACGLL